MDIKILMDAARSAETASDRTVLTLCGYGVKVSVYRDDRVRHHLVDYQTMEFCRVNPILEAIVTCQQALD